MATEWWFFLLIEGFGAFFVEREIFPPWAPAAPACESATCCTPEKNSFIMPDVVCSLCLSQARIPMR
jgi:hypothetical protein